MATDQKSQFAERLREVAVEKGLPAARGMNTRLAEVFGVTTNAARKWVLGLGLPELDQAIAIAKWSDVNVEWLLTGRGPKRGNHVSFSGIVVDEMLRTLPREERQESIAMLKYELTKAGPLIAQEQAARYIAALDTYVTDQHR